MDDLERIKKHHGGPHLGNTPQGPAWKRIHRSPFFWIAAFFILVAMAIFVLSLGFSLWPHAK
jgi:hypothetical protein